MLLTLTKVKSTISPGLTLVLDLLSCEYGPACLQHEAPTNSIKVLDTTWYKKEGKYGKLLSLRYL